MKHILYLLIAAVVLVTPFGCDSDNGSGDDEKVRMYKFGMRFDSTGAEDFVAKTSDPELINALAAELQNPPAERSFHIHGIIDRGNDGYNLNWSWHFIAEEWNLAEMSIEVCDGTPSYVEENLEDWLAMQDSFCPWDSYVKEEVINE